MAHRVAEKPTPFTYTMSAFLNVKNSENQRPLPQQTAPSPVGEGRGGGSKKQRSIHNPLTKQNHPKTIPKPCTLSNKR